MKLDGKIGVGMLGGGFMATVHSRAARAAGADLVGVFAGNDELTAAAVSDLGFGKGYADLASMLADDAVDVIHVCTPNALHYEQALAAIKAGKHVICEKPLAVTAAEAASLAQAAAAAGVVATVPFAYRFHPMVREARARIAAGEVGWITMINGSYLQDWLLTALDNNWRVSAKDGGASRAWGDIGSHLADMIEFVSGQRIARVAAVKQTVFDKRAGSDEVVTTEDAVALTMVTDQGAIGTLTVSQVVPGHKNHMRWEIAGTEQTLAFDAEAPETLTIGRRECTMVVPRDAAHLSPDAARLCRVPSGHPQGYQDAFNAFVRDTYSAILTGVKPEGLPQFADGARAAAITEAVMESAASGNWTEVPPMVG